MTAEEAPKEEAPMPTRSTTTAPVLTTVTYVPPPVTQESPPSTGNNDGVTGGLVNEINKPPSLSPTPTPSLISNVDEDTGPSMFLDGFATYQEINQTNYSDSSAG